MDEFPPWNKKIIYWELLPTTEARSHRRREKMIGINEYFFEAFNKLWFVFWKHGSVSFIHKW